MLQDKPNTHFHQRVAILISHWCKSRSCSSSGAILRYNSVHLCSLTLIERFYLQKRTHADFDKIYTAIAEHLYRGFLCWMLLCMFFESKEKMSSIWEKKLSFHVSTPTIWRCLLVLNTKHVKLFFDVISYKCHNLKFSWFEYYLSIQKVFTNLKVIYCISK